MKQLADSLAKIKTEIANIEGYLPQMHDKTVEQSYEQPVDEGNEDGAKKKMFAAKIKKLTEG